jgi:hypothetical protein
LGEVFHKYFKEKKAQASRTEAQEAARIQIRTMQQTILPPPEPLGSENATTELDTNPTSTAVQKVAAYLREYLCFEDTLIEEASRSPKPSCTKNVLY